MWYFRKQVRNLLVIRKSECERDRENENRNANQVHFHGCEAEK